MLFNPFVPNASFLYPLKTSENPTVFWCFQGLEKGYIGKEWVKEIVYWRLPHLSVHWLIMRVGFEIKGSKRKSSVNRFNLFKVLIVWSTSFFQECSLFIRFFIFIFIIPVCNYLCRLFRKFRINLFNRQWSRLVGSK